MSDVKTYFGTVVRVQRSGLCFIQLDGFDDKRPFPFQAGDIEGYDGGPLEELLVHPRFVVTLDEANERVVKLEPSGGRGRRSEMERASTKLAASELLLFSAGLR